ncbi:MAG: 6-methylpretetramide 4-monooxygenase [Actinomycetota bacterium]|jgi:monooxygenase|nr:6-methylpretetramide 4-monooxygenase [Actinomycetota bacterium]
METVETEYCIVGGGPAGLTLALLLVRSGHQVLLVERTGSLNREYRGEILQPGVLSILDQLDVLEGARLRGCYELPRFQLVENDKVHMDIDYTRLGGPHNYLLSMPQGHLLAEVLAKCSAFPNFKYLPNTSVVGLLGDGSEVTGVRTRGRDGGEAAIKSDWVVGADGRHSRTRRLADIGYTRLDVFEHDVVWFKLSLPHDQDQAGVRVFRAGGNPVLAYDSFPEALQFGWTSPHKRYRSIAEKGLDHVKEQLTLAIPPYARFIEEQIHSLDSLTLLDVFGGLAGDWVRDGLVLIGDSAHTHPPIGAQGINLAIQDAVLLHPALLSARKHGGGKREALARFQSERRADVGRVLKLQERQARAMLSQSRVGSFVRPKLAPLFSRSPLAMKMTRTLAFGPRPVELEPALFVA